MVFKRQFPDESFDQTYQEKAMIGDKILELMELYPGFNADKSYTICGLGSWQCRQALTERVRMLKFHTDIYSNIKTC